MSHFYTLVILPDGKFDESAVGRLLAPYDENLEVPEYDRRCGCVGGSAETAASNQMQAELGTWETVRAEFSKRADASEEIWKAEVYKPRRARKAELLAAHPDKDKPDPECEDCNGTGAYRSTYNPKSKWDWWVIGGRWGDVASRGHAKVSSLVERRLPFAIVTPDGEWYGKGRMGWWGMVSDEKDDWPDQARAILAQYPDHIGVVCDLHI